MSQGPNDHGIVELSVKLGELQVTIKGPVRKATKLLQDITSRGPPSSPAHSGTSETSFAVVSEAEHTSSRRSETSAEIEASFEGCPAYLIADGHRLSGGPLSGQDRVRRAWLAGKWARAFSSGRSSTPNATPQLPLAIEVLRCAQIRAFAAPYTDRHDHTGLAWGNWPHQTPFPIRFPLNKKPRCTLGQASPTLTSCSRHGFPRWIRSCGASRHCPGHGSARALCAHMATGGNHRWRRRMFSFGNYEAGRWLSSRHATRLPPKVIQAGNSAALTDMFGPSTRIVVPSVIVEYGHLMPTGSDIEVLVADCRAQIARHLRRFGPTEEIVYGFDEDSPFALPALDALIPLVRSWLVGDQAELGAFYTPKELEDLPDTPPSRNATQRGPGRKPTASAGQPKAKRPTAASLAVEMKQLVDYLPKTSEQLATLSHRQDLVENRLAHPMSSASLISSRPLGAALAPTQEPPLGQLAKAMGAPPRSTSAPNLGLLGSLTETKPAEIQGLESEKLEDAVQLSDVSLALAVLEQSKALTTLVSQIAAAQNDPMADLSAGSSASTRGAAGRACLQAELAQQKGTFFQSVLLQMARRMSPTTSVDVSPQVLMDRGVSGTRYLERFGGYSRQRELDHAAAVPSDDSLRLLAAGQHPGSEGCSGIAGCVHRASCFGQWPHGLGHLAVSSGGPPVGDLSESPDSQHQQSQELRSPCRPEVDHMCIGLPEGVGGDRSEKGRIDSATNRHFPGFIRGAKAEAEIKEVGRKRKRASRARGARDLECGEDRRLCFNGERLRTDEGLESSPLEASLDFCTWAICLPRWISRCKTSFSWHLTKSFTASRHSSSLSSTAFPLPLPLDGCFQCSGPSLSKKRLLAVAKRRLLHILVYSLNVLYLGRFPTAEEVGRRPTVWHLKCYQRLRALIAVCGDDAGRFPGRSGPELVAHLFQLEKFLDRSEEKFDSYQRPSPCEFQPDPSLLLAGDHPELFPYKNLDADRLKLAGEGKWPMADFIEGPLWLPFVEPRFLLHGLDISQCDLPNFAYEDKDENLKLVKIWDRKGLLRLYRSPFAPSHFCRVFNAYKNTDCDRQIGDRRIPNARERAIDGPSAFLPPGFSLTNMRTRPFAERLVASITDRRDFYHQAQVTDERAVSNMLPFAFSEDQLDGCVALDVAKAAEKKASRKKKDRELVGDGFGDARESRFIFQLPQKIGFRRLAPFSKVITWVLNLLWNPMRLCSSVVAF